MEKEYFGDFFEEKKEKTIKDYCIDIINACYYDLSKLIELKVIKAEYDENNKAIWYIAGSEQAYTNYRELRKGLEYYVLHLDNGKYFKEEEFFKMLGELISKRIPTLILSKRTSLQMTCKLMSRVLSQVKKTKLAYSGQLIGRFNYDEKLLETHWDSIEKRLRILSYSPLCINDIMEHSVANYRLSEAMIKNKNIKNVFIDYQPNKDEMSDILSWGKKLGINVFFTELGEIYSFNSKKTKSCIELGGTDSFNSIETNSGCDIFEESLVHVHFN